MIMSLPVLIIMLLQLNLIWGLKYRFDLDTSYYPLPCNSASKLKIDSPLFHFSQCSSKFLTLRVLYWLFMLYMFFKVFNHNYNLLRHCKCLFILSKTCLGRTSNLLFIKSWKVSYYPVANSFYFLKPNSRCADMQSCLIKLRKSWVIMSSKLVSQCCDAKR